jgi:hypothetical protein
LRRWPSCPCRTEPCAGENGVKTITSHRPLKYQEEEEEEEKNEEAMEPRKEEEDDEGAAKHESMTKANNESMTNWAMTSRPLMMGLMARC